MENKVIIQKHSYKKINLADMLILFIIAIRFCYPLNALLGDKGGYIVYYGLYVLFFLTVIFCVKGYIINFIKDLWILFIILAVIITRSILANRWSFGFWEPMSMVISLINMIIAYSIYLYVRLRPLNIQKKIVKLALISLFISMLLSIYYIVFVDMLAVRNAVGIYFGVGDFNLVYSVIFVSIICVSVIKYRRRSNKKLSLCIVGLYIIALLLTVKAGFMTALLLFIIASLVTYFKPKNNLLFVIGSIVGILILIFTKEYIGELFILLSKNNLFSWVINNKIQAIGNLLLGYNSNLDTISRRSMLISFSMKSFRLYPLFGLDYKDYGSYTIGGHAQWFDDLGRFGFVGFLIWVYFYLFTYKKVIRETKDQISKLAVKSSWIIYIILGFWNPNTMSTVTMILFAIVPFSGTLVLNKATN